MDPARVRVGHGARLGTLVYDQNFFPGWYAYVEVSADRVAAPVSWDGCRSRICRGDPAYERPVRDRIAMALAMIVGRC